MARTLYAMGVNLTFHPGSYGSANLVPMDDRIASRSRSTAPEPMIHRPWKATVQFHSGGFPCNTEGTLTTRHGFPTVAEAVERAVADAEDLGIVWQADGLLPTVFVDSLPAVDAPSVDEVRALVVGVCERIGWKDPTPFFFPETETGARS